ncbi:MAG: aminotransferase class IV [Planctomycetota bacterium]
MSDAAPIVFHNGAFLDYPEARVDVQERGTLFADGVYEVVRFDQGRPFAMQAHVDRFARSLDGIELAGVDPAKFSDWSHELLERNELTDAKVYWQVSRGPATRDFLISDMVTPSLTLLAYPAVPIERGVPLKSGSALIVDDCRWTNCWIKSLMLLPASLAKTRAHRAGAVEAIFERAKPGVTEKHITEGSATNLFAVRGGELFTHPDDGWVLGGITRDALLKLADRLGVAAHDDRPFTRQDLLAADEIFVCSTTQVVAITSILGDADQPAHPIADGRPGSVTQQLHEAYLDAILAP